MNEKKRLLPCFIRKIIPVIAMIVLLVAIGAVFVMILNDRTNPQLSDPQTDTPTYTPTDAPTEPPTEMPTEPPTEAPTAAPKDPIQDLKDKATQYMLKNMYNGHKYALHSFEQYGTWDYYIADFRYMLNGIPTEDSCWVSIWFDGRIRGISKFHTGKFANAVVTDEMIRRTEEKLYSENFLSRETTHIQSREFSMGISDLHMRFNVLTDGSNETVSYYVEVPMFASDREYPDKNSIPIPDGPISEETAVYYLSQYVDDTGGYILKEFSYSPDGLYTAIFHHQLGGLYTGDMCTVIMREDKSLYNCFVDGEGMYDDIHLTEEDMKITTKNVYVLYGLSKDEWVCNPKMVKWYFGRLTIGFDVRKTDGSDVRYFNVPIPYKKQITDPEDAAFWAAEYFGKEEFNYTVTNCTRDENTEFPHYDVTFLVGNIESSGTVIYEYTCEVGIPNGQLRIISIKPV